ncbi:V-type proton ATPase subunit G [Sphaceloma murrayae]|uniref:V-type proton ATPase subunit G n=1 Tax=Sphaceloma murrayae TaxID=2082308 RepID=A0A2K1QJ90_9PEZI|nr:V-type proton ATPase subunit G [Sphaceloma murrayae]
MATLSSAVVIASHALGPDHRLTSLQTPACFMAWTGALHLTIVHTDTQDVCLKLCWDTDTAGCEFTKRDKAGSSWESKGRIVSKTKILAERDAQQIVQKAREYRTKRVKDARSEAQKEIDEYRKQKEEEFKKFEKEHSSGNKKAEQDAEKDTEEKLKETKEVGKKSGKKVIDDLLNAVSDVRPVVPNRVEQPT